MYGGSTTSILLNTPGESSSVVTALDGYQMAKQGRAGAALSIAAIGSFVAGIVSLLGLVLLAKPSIKTSSFVWTGGVFFFNAARSMRRKWTGRKVDYKSNDYDSFRSFARNDRYG